MLSAVDTEEVVMVDDIPFPPQLTPSPSSNNPLSLLGYGNQYSFFPFVNYLMMMMMMLGALHHHHHQQV